MQILPSVLAGLKAVCATFPDVRKGRGGNIEISDFGVSALSMFFMQSASFLAYSARAGERPGSLQRPDPVRDRQNSLRQLYPRQAGRGGSRAFAALFRTHGDAADRAAPAAGLRSVGMQNPDRLGRDAVFRLAKARLSELPHPRALQRHDRELSLPAVGDGRGARPLQGRS
jgi:hypothetical protein